MSGSAPMHVVRKPFRCSFDGIKTETLAPGDQRDFGAMAGGLVRAGLIAAAAAGPTQTLVADQPILDEIHEEKRPAEPAAPASAAVEIPDNWRDLPWSELVALAAKVSTGPVTKKKHAVAAIEAELALRAARA